MVSPRIHACRGSVGASVNVVTHEFGLADYRDAVHTALDREAGAIKVVFRPALG